jgi:uncharacterized protein (TIGR04255 family)
MADHQHLNHAPVIEAILGFQADVSKGWDPDIVRAGLSTHYPDFPKIQEQRDFESKFTMSPGKDLESSATVHGVRGFILHRNDGSSAIQIRRDGFAFSHLQPYPDWHKFVSNAIDQWKISADWFGIDSPYSIFLRFINRLSYPIDDFKFSDYFENSPKPPIGTSWRFSSFREHHVYAPEGDRFLVESVFSRTGDPSPPKKVDFLLDLTIKPIKSLAESGDSIESLLPEMRKLKNSAFFAKFTERGLEPYK